MPESFWDLVGRLSYIISILGVGDPQKPKEEIEELRARFEKMMKGRLWIVTMREPTGGRDFDELVCLGVFTSRHFAAMSLAELIEKEPWFSDELRQELFSESGTYTLRTDDLEDCDDDIVYTIMPVARGMDPKK